MPSLTTWFRRIGGALLIGLMMAVPLLASADEALTQQTLSDQAQRLLDAVFGKGNLVALVNVSVSAASSQVRYTKQSQAAVTAQKSTTGERIQILPGYPVIKNLAPDSGRQLPFDSVTSYSKPSIQQVSITVIASQDFPRGQFGRVQSLLTQALGLQANRDKVTITVQKFMAGPGTPVDVSNPKSRGMMPSAGGVGSLVQGAALWVMVLLLGVFAAAYIWMQLRSQQLMMAVLQRQSQGGKGSSDSSSISISPSMPAPQAAQKSTKTTGEMRLNDSKMKRYFDFVTDQNFENLQYILKKEKVGLENLAVLIPCLEPHLAAKVIADLDAGSQSSIILNMADPRMFNKAVIEKFEGQLKIALESLIGGEGLTQEVLGHLPEQTKRHILATLQQGNPAGYQRVRPLVVLFDDLLNLSGDDVKYLAGTINRDVLFTALIGAEPQIQAHFKDNMLQGVRTMMTEFIELRSKFLSSQEIESAREYVLQTALQLQEEGKVNLKNKA